MSSKISALAFIFGVASGAVIAWHCIKKKYEDLAQEEIDSVKEAYAKKEREMQANNVAKPTPANEKPDLKEYSERLQKEGYTQIFEGPQTMKEYEDQVRKDVDLIKEASVKGRPGRTQYSDAPTMKKEETKERSKPYVIPPEQFGMEDDYEQISLTYYADHVVTDELDEIVEDVEETIGFESLAHFGEYEDDSVYVRNDERKCDYEILLDQMTYVEARRNRPRPTEV